MESLFSFLIVSNFREFSGVNVVYWVEPLEMLVCVCVRVCGLHFLFLLQCVKRCVINIKLKKASQLNYHY